MLKFSSHFIQSLFNCAGSRFPGCSHVNPHLGMAIWLLHLALWHYQQMLNSSSRGHFKDQTDRQTDSCSVPYALISLTIQTTQSHHLNFCTFDIYYFLLHASVICLAITGYKNASTKWKNAT